MQPNRTPPPELKEIDEKLKDVYRRIEEQAGYEVAAKLLDERAKLLDQKNQIMNAWRFRLASEGAC